MKEIPPEHIYGIITVSADEIRLLNLDKDFFNKQLVKNLMAVRSQLISDVEEARKSPQIIVMYR